MIKQSDTISFLNNVLAESRNKSGNTCYSQCQNDFYADTLLYLSNIYVPRIIHPSFYLLNQSIEADM